MKRIIIPVLMVAVLASTGAVFAQQDAVKVVGHATTTPDTATERELERIFLKKKTKWRTGQTAEPVDQKSTTVVRKLFTEEVLNKDLARVESHWQAQVFSGKATPPETLASDQEVIDFVRSTPGAVGYVSANASTDGVKVIRIGE